MSDLFWKAAETLGKVTAERDAALARIKELESDLAVSDAVLDLFREEGAHKAFHQFAVVSADYSRPFMAGAYQTLEAAVRAQCGSPDRWHIYKRFSA